MSPPKTLYGRTRQCPATTDLRHGHRPRGRRPILFSKLDIKDGYWRMVVPEDNEWHFAHVLPKASLDEPTNLVIPSSLQMGWCDSPAYFCAASETALDVAETLAAKPEGSLEEQISRACCSAPRTGPRSGRWKQPQQSTRLLLVYINDFIQLAQMTDPNKLRHFSCAVLHGIQTLCLPTNEGFRARGRGRPHLPEETNSRRRAMVGIAQGDIRLGFRWSTTAMH
jgi:hypothetical protein